MTKKTNMSWVVLLVATSFSFTQDIFWGKSYGGKHTEFLYDAITTSDYGFILAESSFWKNRNKKDHFIYIKLINQNFGELKF